MSEVIEDSKVVPATAATAGVVNNIIVNVPPAVNPAPKAVSKPAKSGGISKLPSKSLPIDYLPEPLGKSILFDEFITGIGKLKPEYYMDDKTGERVTRFRANDGSVATLRESTTDHNKVTLTLTDSKGVLVTQGDARGFSLSKEGRVVQHTTNWPILRDTLNCPAGSESIESNKTEAATREKLQEFAQNHLQLASALRGVELPVTVAGGLPVTFAKAVDVPTQYRACPEDRSGIVLERLTEKSAKR